MTHSEYINVLEDLTSRAIATLWRYYEVEMAVALGDLAYV